MADTVYLKEIVLTTKGQPTKLFSALVAKDVSKIYSRAYLPADLDISATPAWTEIVCTTEVSDNGLNYSIATGRFTCPVAGIYLVETLVGCKVKDDSQTLVACYTALGINGAVSIYGNSFYGSEMFVFRANNFFIYPASAGTKLSPFIYAVESAASQPTILGGIDDSRFTVTLLHTT